MPLRGTAPCAAALNPLERKEHPQPGSAAHRRPAFHPPARTGPRRFDILMRGHGALANGVCAKVDALAAEPRRSDATDTDEFARIDPDRYDVMISATE